MTRIGETPPRCPVCLASAAYGEYTVTGVPVRSATVGSDRASATPPTGDIRLAACDACGLIFNAAFDPLTQEFWASYEEAQDFSPTFSGYTTTLAERLAQRYGLRGKHIVEIGCGKGGFLSRLCRIAGATGVGIDPACDPDRIPADCRELVTVVKAEYGDEHREIVEAADFVCCRHTLEHIFEPVELLQRLRAHIDGKPGVAFFVDVPSGSHVLDVGGFWDVYYEHCMYYTDDALVGVLRRAGFEAAGRWREYADQYLVVESFAAEPAAIPPARPATETLARGTARLEARRGRWSRWLSERPPGSRVALWGSGSRAVGFLGAIADPTPIRAVVDISPHRAGKFMPGHDRPILSPADLAAEGCDAVIVMNPVYRDEIAASMRELGVDAPVLTVDAPPP